MLALLAVLVGVGARAGAIGFRCLIASFTELFSGHSDPSALRNVESGSSRLVVLSSVAATAVGRLACGSEAFLALP